MLRKALLTLLFLYPALSFPAQISWETLAPGIEYTKIPLDHIPNHGRLHAFKVNLNNNQFNLVMAKDFHLLASFVQPLAERVNAPLAINGGFFNPDHQPLGLRIQNKKTRTPLKKISWWGVFFIKNNHAYVLPERSFYDSPDIQFAIQAGPRLVVNNVIPKLKKGYAERSALGITQEGDVILVNTEKAALTTTELAKIMRRSNENGGFDCPNALNLDGGSSSQIYAHINDFYLSVPNLSRVTDIITVTPRNQ